VQPVGLERAAERHAPLEQAGGVQPLQRHRGRAVVPAHLDVVGVRLQHAHDADRLLVGARELVVTEQRAGFRVTRVDQRVDVTGGQFALGGHLLSLANRGHSPIFLPGE
jgi:hypothetical protein